MDIALKKAMAFADEKNAVIIAADTAVVSKSKFLGKPETEQDAQNMLRALSGKLHEVYTGVAQLFNNGSKSEVKTFYDKSLVKFKKLSADIIESYVKSGSPMDKAGGYGIQDGIVVESWTGSYSNIVGLPLEKLRKLRKIIRA